MRVVVDSREQKPLSFDAFPDIQTEVMALRTGDYSLVGMQELVAVERKSETDLIHSLTYDRARFEAELERSRALRYFGIVIETTWHRLAKGEYRSKASPQSIVGSLFSIATKYNAGLFLVGTDRTSAAYAVQMILRHFAKQTVRTLTAALMHADAGA